MKAVLYFILLCLCGSCIPLRIAPTIDDHKVVTGKKFKRHLPKDQLFIFSDPKEAEAFYRFVDHKFDGKGEMLDTDIGFDLNNEHFYLTFYEVEIPTKFFNMGAVFVDLALASAEIGPILEDQYSSRKGHWYIAIGVHHNRYGDCLAITSPYREIVLAYLRDLKQEYISAQQYHDAFFKM